MGRKQQPAGNGYHTLDYGLSSGFRIFRQKQADPQKQRPVDP